MLAVHQTKIKVTILCKGFWIYAAMQLIISGSEVRVLLGPPFIPGSIPDTWVPKGGNDCIIGLWNAHAATMGLMLVL